MSMVFLPDVWALTELQAISEYRESGKSNKAIAISGKGDNAISSIVHSQPSPALASSKALAACESKRLALDSIQPCEIRVVNQREISTAEQIRKAVPRQHPLFLWKIQSTRATVYLAGSIHVLKQSLYPMAQQFQSAFNNSDTVVVEVDTMNLNQKDMTTLVNRYFLLPEPQTLRQILNATELADLAEYLGIRNTSIEAVEKLKPSMLAVQLSLNQLVSMGYLQEHGLERFFLKQIGPREILQLESIEQQFDLLGNPSMKLQREILRDTISQENELDDNLTALVTAWLSGNTESFEALTQSMASDSPEYKVFSEKLLDERNMAMAIKIDSYLKLEGNYFIMIGAAHLVGKNSVVTLLTKKGHHPVQQNSNDRT